MQKSLSFVSLLCAFSLCTGLVNAQTLQLSVYPSSNNWWLAVIPNNGAAATATIEVQEAGSAVWSDMAPQPGWGYWTYSASNPASGFSFPLSFRLTSVTGAVVTINAAVTTLNGVGQTIDSNTQYGSGGSTQAPTVPPTNAPQVVTTQAATNVASGCSDTIQVLVPLYVYPGTAWYTVAAGAEYVDTVAIINPDSGPESEPNNDYVTYMEMMHEAGVEMVGYVYTSYGTRDISEVQADIDTYASEYSYLSGIFLDEGSPDASMSSYYQTLYDYIESMPGYYYVIINPGVVPDSSYLSASTQMVSFEGYGSDVAAAAVPSFASCNNVDHFSAIVHDVDVGSMPSVVDELFAKSYFGFIYVTDGAGGCCTYNALSSYYASMISYIASKQ